MKVNFNKISTIFLLPLYTLIHINLINYIPDDAYIHLRIVRNFIDFGLPYFNPKDPVLASSSPLWTILLRLICGANYYILAVINSLILWLFSIKLFELSKDLVPSVSQIKNIILVTIATLILTPASVGLMETPLALLFLIIGLLSYNRKSHLSVFWFSLAICTRLEILIFSIIILAFAVITKKIKFYPSLFYGFTPVIFVIFFLYYYYETIIPQATIAKSKAYQLSLSTFLYYTISQLYERLLIRGIVILPLISLLIALPLVIFMGLIKPKVKISKEPLLLVFAGLILFLAYALKGVLQFYWYTPLYLFPVIYGLGLRISYHRGFWCILLLALPTVFTGIECIYAGVISPKESPYALEMSRVENYLNIGSVLYRKYPKARLMAAEIGALGFTFKGKIIDSVGLASPEAVKYHPLKNRSIESIAGIPLKMVEDLHPELIVALDIHMEELIGSKIIKTYQITKVPAFSDKLMKNAGLTEYWMSKNINILIRKDINKTQNF
jgi:hypothetical protein